MLKKIILSPYPYVLLLSYYCVWLAWDAVKLPFHDPAGIISALPQIHYNPTNNILRFLLAILVPPLACLAVWAIIHKKPDKIWNIYNKFRFPRIALSSLVIGACIVLCIGIGIVQGSTNPANNPTDVYGGPYSHALVDTFHEGETLGPAISYEQPNLAPYRDFVIVHGVFQDALRTDIAFNLFGKTIGAARAFANILTILAFIAYFFLLLLLFRGHVFKAAIGLLITGLLTIPLTALPATSNSMFGVLLPFRDIATILFLMAAIIGLRSIDVRNRKKLTSMSLIIGFITIAGFANSIDRALFIATLSLVWLILVYIVNTSKLFLKTVLLPYIIGILIGIPVLGLALKWAFGDFISYLLTISKYKEYLDGIIFTQPDTAVTVILLLVATILTIFGAIFLNALRKSNKKGTLIKSRLAELLRCLKPIVEKYSIAILLFITGLFFLRSAIGRALPDHWIYSVQWLYLFLAYIGINYLFKALKSKEKVLNFLTLLLLGSCLIIFAFMVKGIDIHNDTFPINVPDKDLMRTDYIQTANYLKNNLKGDESFVTLTSEASWYYFVGKPSPIKYPIIWYAFTKDQRDIIASELDAGKNIKYVITNNNWTSDFDYVPNEVRFPEVYAVLKKDYVPYVGFGQQTIWIRA
jgi:hypothetical protein